MIATHITAGKPIGGFWYCKRCGLVYLKNEISQAAIKYGCEYDTHSEFLKIERRIRAQQRIKNGIN